jgi:predicted methyltransferase
MRRRFHLPLGSFFNEKLGARQRHAARSTRDDRHKGETDRFAYQFVKP